MKWTIDYLSEHGVLRARLSGPVSLHDYQAFIAEVWQKGATLKVFKLLADLRKIRVDVSLLDIHDMPEISKAIVTPGRRKTAIFYPQSSPKDMDKARYLTLWLESVGLQVQVFQDEQAALTWLKLPES